VNSSVDPGRPTARTLTDRTQTVEVVYLITSASHTDVSPQRLAVISRLGAMPVGHRKSPALGSGRDLRRGRFAGTYRAGAAGDGHLPQSRDQHPTDRRVEQHCRRTPPPGQTPRSWPRTGTGLMKRDYSGALTSRSMHVNRHPIPPPNSIMNCPCCSWPVSIR
jgi:hypothetical protein